MMDREEPTELDYYRLLGVSRDATVHHIKKAFRRLALIHHPDKAVGRTNDGSHFRKIREAHDTLCNDHHRYCFDLRYERICAEWDKYEAAREEHQFRQHAARGKEGQDKESQAKAAKGSGDRERAERAAKLEKEAREKEIRRREEMAEQRSQEAGRRAREAQEQAAKERLARQERAEAAQKAKEAEEESRRAKEAEAEHIQRMMAEMMESFSKLRQEYDTLRKDESRKARRNENAQVPKCTHRMWWPRVYGPENCHYCSRFCPRYTLRCPDCDVRACIPCKIEQSGG